LEHSPNGLSDNSYIKSSILNKNFYKIGDGGSFLFNTNNIGLVKSLDSNNIKTFNSFSLGGSSFSGFDYRGLGPKNSNNIYLGGNKFFTSTFGIGTNFFSQQQDNLYLKVFLTTGSIWDSDYSTSKYKQRTSLGTSLDFLTPIGPVSISYGIPIQKSTNDILRRFDFRIGGSF
jgi:outer membrane protein insertion porin family